MDEMDVLREELEHYKAQKEKIRNIVGQIGGATSHRRVTMINIVFLVIVVSAFAFDLLRHIMGWKVPLLPPMLLLEVAVLLVSLKIIWMIHKQSKVDHFQFWVLNSIEFQINMLSRRIADMTNTIRDMNKTEEQA